MYISNDTRSYRQTIMPLMLEKKIMAATTETATTTEVAAIEYEQNKNLRWKIAESFIHDIYLFIITFKAQRLQICQFIALFMLYCTNT